MERKLKVELFDLEHMKRTYFKLVMPMTLSMVITMIYNIADTYFVAQTGQEEIVAGVSLCFPLSFFTMALGNIFAQGGNSLISRMLGAGEYESAKRVSSFCFYWCIIAGIALGVIMIIFANPLLGLMGAREETWASAADYYMVMAFGTPICTAYFIHSNLIRCEGLAAESMIGNIIGTVTNIILDPIFITNFEMGAFGAALATVIAHAVTVAVMLLFVKKKCQFITINPKYCRIKGEELKEICTIGTSAAILNLSQSISMIILNNFMIAYGVGKVAAMGIVQKITKIPNLVFSGLTYGAIPLFGYLYGSKNMKKLRELIRFCVIILSITGLAMTILLVFGGEYILPSFLEDEASIGDGIYMMQWLSIGNIFMALVLLITILFQAIGKAIPAFVLSISRQGVLFITILFIASALFGYTGIIATQFVADAISFIVAVILYAIVAPVKKGFEKKS